MRFKLFSSAMLAGGAAVASMLLATSAFAHAAPFAVTAGSAPSGTAVAVTGTATGTVTFKDTRTNQAFTCTVSVISGSITAGPSRTNPLASINGGTARFTDANDAPCTGPAGWALKIVGSGTWAINGTDSTAGTTTGTITNIRAHVSMPSLSCEFDIGSRTSTTGFSSSGTTTITPGSQGGSYVNSTQVLTTNTAQSALGLWNVNPSATNHNCISASILNQGDGFSFSGAYKLVASNSAYNPIAVN